MLIGARTAAWSGGGGGVEFVDWIESDGSAYIDTGYTPTDLNLVFDIAIARGTAIGNWNTMIFGSTDVSSNFYTGNSIGCVIIAAVSFLSGKFRDNFNTSDITYLLKSSDIHELMIDAGYLVPTYGRFHQSLLYVDGDIFGRGVSAASSADDTIPPYSLFAFGANKDGVCIGKPPAGVGVKIKRLSFVNSRNVRECDFRAAKFGGEYGLYDLVGKTWHGGIGGTISGPIA